MKKIIAALATILPFISIYAANPSIDPNDNQLAFSNRTLQLYNDQLKGQLQQVDDQLRLSSLTHKQADLTYKCQKELLKTQSELIKKHIILMKSKLPAKTIAKKVHELQLAAKYSILKKQNSCDQASSVIRQEAQNIQLQLLKQQLQFTKMR